jgi:glutamine cyclotransferase
MAFQVRNGLMSMMLLASLFAMAACANESELAESVTAESPRVPNNLSTTAAPPVYSYRVIRSYPHDHQAFTQGLVYEAGELYEGTGLRGQSSLRRVDLETGLVRQQHVLPKQYFGEGITIFGDRIIQLTWQSRIGFVYDRASFQLVQQFSYPTEGWGITHDGNRLIMSDGTANLYFLEPDTFTRIDHIEVHDDQGPVVRLNELEYVRGDVYANVWQTDRIARIELLTGRVAAWIDLTGLLSAAERQPHVDVLNGIAYDAENDRLFVTGKWWPKLFEIQIVELE